MNIPPEETIPPLALQVTAVLPVPLTLAVNCWLVLVVSEVEVGDTETFTVDVVSDAETTKGSRLERFQFCWFNIRM
ncbi:MAG TPA: hypothetical protein VIL63_04455 [Terriglobales bacterium]